MAIRNPYENQYPNRKDNWEHTPLNNPPKKPAPLTVADLFPSMDRWAIGFEGMFDTLSVLAKAKSATYPPYNITKFGDGKWAIQMALAGFRKDDVEITVNDRTLTVSSDVQEPEESYGQVIHHGIAQRNFKTEFAMAEHVEVDVAKMEDGILTINLVTNIPEEKKPKVIDIN